jgi:hypothetical protein
MLHRLPRTTLVVLLLTATILASWGCSPDLPEAETDVKVVQVRVDLRIGAMGGAGPEAFGRISGLLGDRQGRILVADVLSDEVRVFDPQGAFLFSFGGRGSGPEEFSGPCCLGQGPDGRVWVRDGGNQRYSIVQVDDNGGRFLTSLRMAHSDVNFWAPVTFSTAGNLIDIGHRASRSGEIELIRFEVSEGGEVLDSTPVPAPSPEDLGQFQVVRETAEGNARLFFSQPFAPGHLVAHGPRGSWAEGLGSEYSVQVHGPTADYAIDRQTEGPLLSPREKDLGQQVLERDARRAGRRPGDMPYTIPDRKPSLRSLFFDSTGRLWIERNTPDGEPRIADVWSTDGTLERRIQWPREISLQPPAWVGDGWGLGILRDSLDVEYVVRVRF